MPKNVKTETLRTASAVREAFAALKGAAKYIRDTLRSIAQTKGAFKGSRTDCLRGVIEAMRGVMSPMIGKGDGAFSRDGALSIDVLCSLTGTGDWRLDARQTYKVMQSKDLTGKDIMSALISPANPGGRYLFEPSQSHAANRGKTRNDAFLDACANALIDHQAGVKLAAPKDKEETKEDKAKREAHNREVSRKRKLALLDAGMFPARARKVGNKDKEGNKSEKVILDYKIASTYEHKLQYFVDEEKTQKSPGNKETLFATAVCVEHKPGKLALAAWGFMADNGYFPHGVIDKGANRKKSDGGRNEAYGCSGCGAKASLAAMDVDLVGCSNRDCPKVGNALVGIASMSDGEAANFERKRKALKANAASEAAAVA